MDALQEALAGLNLDANETARLRSLAHDAVNDAGEAIINSRLQTVATVIKPSKPGKFAGVINAIECLNFLDAHAEYYEIMTLAESDWVKYTSLDLEGDAKAWWRDSPLTITSSWDDFRRAFTAAFTPPNSVQAAQLALTKLKQDKLSVAEYTARFRRHARLIPGFHDNQDHAVFLYMEGLETETGREVKLRQPTTLDAAINQATIVHSILHPTDPSPLSTATTATTNIPQPMDLDNMRTMLATLLTSVELSNMNPRFSKLSDNDRRRSLAQGICFRCRKRGHIARDCKSNGNSRFFNNLETKGNTSPVTSDNNTPGKDKGEL